MASSVSAAGSRVSTEAAGSDCIARLNSATGPSNIQKVTKIPTARNVTSLTMDSAAIASIRPSWCSVASICRVPNSTANTAIEIATNSAMSPSSGRPVVGGRHDMGDDRFERERHRLELQRDVGNRADDRDQGDGRGHRLALAVARGDEVGDRGDVLPLGEPHHARDQRREQPDHQHRADIDGQELVAAARGRADRAEERPGRAVDRKRQRIDQQPRASLAAETADAVPVARYEEQQPDVAERDGNDDPALQHVVSPTGRSRRGPDQPFRTTITTDPGVVHRRGAEVYSKDRL